jgi:short-subunit dehydrogenase
MKPVTLITGASGGIGAAIADKFAAQGRQLVLVARREAQLNAVADRIAERGHLRPQLIALDLGEADATARIAAALADGGLEPEIVVNNAGFGMLGSAASLDRSEQLAMINLNVRVTTDLSLRFIDSLARHRGGILNVSSVLGFLPGPGMAVYHATKAYVLSFSLALHQELKPRGIRVTALCPGPVDTEFGVRPVGRLSRRLVRTVERVARDGVEGFMAGKSVVVPGRSLQFMSMLPRMLPRGVMLWMVGASKRRNREG